MEGLASRDGQQPHIMPKIGAQITDPFRLKDPSIYIIHYMDDILLAGPDTDHLLCFSQQLSKALMDAHLQIAADKTQLKTPYLFSLSLARLPLTSPVVLPSW